jgi:hypothetical protein
MRIIIRKAAKIKLKQNDSFVKIVSLPCKIN